MKQFIKEYFSFSKKERNGFIVLITINIILIVILKLIPYFHVQKEYDLSRFEEEITKFEEQISYDTEKYEKGLVSYDFEPFNFDPNTITDEQWKNMGLSEKVILTINNYKSKGGKFYSANDITKIYGFPNELYLKIKDHIIIEKSYQNNNSSKNNKQFTYKDTTYNKSDRYDDNIIVNINLCDKKELSKIRGLPYNIIDRILNYRELLGGFYHKEQLMEVYGMDEEVYDLLSQRIELAQTDIVKIPVNNADFKELLKHPYLEYENVRMISNYRKDYKINSIKDLEINNIISKEQGEKLSAYLEF